MPAILTSPYDSADDVLNLTRSLGNDAIRSLAGNLLSDSQPYVLPFLNSAYRKLQRRLANAGYQTFKKTTQLPNVGAATPIDPGTTVSIGYTNYFNGTTNLTSPLLPADLCWPLRLRERTAGSTQYFQPMDLNRDGLESRRQNIKLRDWVWQNDQILMNGSSQANDLELYYVPFLPDLILTPTPSQVLIVRGSNALAAFVLWEYAVARGSAPVADCKAMAMEYLSELIQSDASQKARGNYRRQSYTGMSHSGWGRF